MSYKTCDFVAKTFGWNYGYFITYTFVGLEIKRETRVIFFNYYPRGFLYRLCAHATLRNVRYIVFGDSSAGGFREGDAGGMGMGD